MADYIFLKKKILEGGSTTLWRFGEGFKKVKKKRINLLNQLSQQNYTCARLFKIWASVPAWKFLNELSVDASLGSTPVFSLCINGIPYYLNDKTSRVYCFPAFHYGEDEIRSSLFANPEPVWFQEITHALEYSTRPDENHKAFVTAYRKSEFVVGYIIWTLKCLLKLYQLERCTSAIEVLSILSQRNMLSFTVVRNNIERWKWASFDKLLCLIETVAQDSTDKVAA